MFYLDSNLKLSFNLLSFESIGKIIKCFVCEESTKDLNEVEKILYLEIKQFNEGKKEKRKTAALKRWEKRKAGAIQKEKTQKEDLPKNATFKDYKKALTVNNNQNADYSTFYFSKVKQDLTPEQMDIIIKAEDIF